MSKMVSATAQGNALAVPVGKVDIAMSAFLTMDVDMGHAKFHGSASVMKAGEAFSVIRI